MLRLLILLVSMLTTRRPGGTAGPGRLPLRDRDPRESDGRESGGREGEAWEGDRWADDRWADDRRGAACRRPQARAIGKAGASPQVSGLTLDAGALIAFERNDRVAVTTIVRVRERGFGVAIPAGVLGQVWRDGARQVRLVRLLGSSSVEIVPLEDRSARAAGQLCGTSRTADVIDASVVLCARERGHAVMTSDLDDLRRLDPNVQLIAV